MKRVNGKYSQKLLDSVKRYDANTFKTTSKRATQETVEWTADLIGEKNPDKSTRTTRQSISSKSKSPMQTKNIDEIPREIYVPSKKGNKLLMNLD